MEARFNKFERTAGIFVLTSLLGCLLFVITAAVKRGWFESKTRYYTKLETAEGVRVGSSVEMSGIRVGTVESLEIDDNDIIKARIGVLSKFTKRIRKDSRIQLMRPFVIGDKVLYVTSGTETEPQLAAGEWLESVEIVGLTDLLNGKKLLPYIETMSAAFGELKTIVDTLLKQKGSANYSKMIEAIPKFMEKLAAMSTEMTVIGKQMTDDNRLGKMITNIAYISDEMRLMMPKLAKVGPNMGEDLAKLVQNLTTMTEEFKKVLPAISEVAPELPRTSRRLVEAVDEAVVVLKALQRSFLLRGSAKEVREEEAEKETKKLRSPASESP